MEQSRNNKGQWKRKGKRLLLIVSLVGGISLAALNVNVLKWIDNELSKEIVVDIPIETVLADVKGSTLEEKVENMKSDIRTAVRNCERAGHEEADAIITFDTGGQASLGTYQFYRPTVIRYSEMFYGKKLTMKEAADVAWNDGSAGKLFDDVVYKDDTDFQKEIGGIFNWKRCAKSTGVISKIQFIRELIN